MDETGAQLGALLWPRGVEWGSWREVQEGVYIWYKVDSHCYTIEMYTTFIKNKEEEWDSKVSVLKIYVMSHWATEMEKELPEE